MHIYIDGEKTYLHLPGCSEPFEAGRDNASCGFASHKHRIVGDKHQGDSSQALRGLDQKSCPFQIWSCEHQLTRICAQVCSHDY